MTNFPETRYIPFFGRRLIFRKTGKNGGWQYHGWYHPKLDKVLN